MTASLHPSVRMEQLGCHWTDFHEIWYLEYFSKICREKSSFAKIGKDNNSYFTCRPIYIFIMTLAIFLRLKIFQTNL